MKKHLIRFVTGATATAVLPPSVGIMDWKVIAGAAVVGGIGGLCGVNVAQRMKRMAAARASIKKAPDSE